MSDYRIQQARAAKGWTQADLAKAIGTTQQQIARYESGDNEIVQHIKLRKFHNALTRLYRLDNPCKTRKNRRFSST